MGRPVAASQSRAVLSMPPVRIGWPSGLNATDHTMPDASWAGRWAGRWRRPRAAPCLSEPPVRIVRPSGLNATDQTAPGCARGGPMGRPVAASHSRAVPSRTR